PKEIVHYMCQESLIQYLRTHLPECIEDESPATIAIENFIRNGETGDRNNKKNFVVQQAKRIEKLLDNIKVCDPAIGSGAFPMGMLQEIFKAKTSLDLTLDHSEVKKQIIQNNLYGVDIENGAVEIARLRFWLALVVDETEPRPLPNLDYKIMQGNSLLESFEGIDLSNVHAVNNFTTIYEPDADLFGRIQTRQLHFTDTKVLRENNLHQLMQAFFNEIDAEKKQEIRLQINKTVHDHIDYNLELQQISLERQTGEASKINNIDVKSSAKKKLEELKKQLKGLKESRNKLHELQNTVNKPYFLWHLFFADVFEKEGFDIVIGNPPYIQLQKIKGEAALLQAAGYHTFTRSGDIYCLFYEQGNKLLKPRGILCYITSNNWMRTKYGELLRKYFIEQTNPIKLLNFEDTKIFETATIETNIFISKKENNQNQLLAVAMKADYKIGDAIERYFRLNNILIDDLDFDEWTILSKNDFQLKLEIEKVGKRLKNYNVQINYGIKTGLIEAFYIDSKTKEEIISTDKLSAEIIKPLLRGRDIKKFTTLKSEDQWIIFTRRGIDINKYPGVKTYLKKYYEQLRPKNKGEKTGRKPGPYKWYEIQDNVAYHKYFEMEKIVWLIITDKPQFAIDYNGYYTNDGTFILTGENLKFVCCILNSKVSDWYFDKIATSSGMGTTMWKKYKIEKLPVPILPDNVILRKFETLADYLIFINDESNLPVNPYTDNRSISSVFEDVLNMMIYELYFREHMHELEIDVLRFVDEKSLPSLGKDNIKNVEIIGGVYKWLQDQDNPIRNRVILSNIRSKNIIRRINSTTH
ncbi:Eco57I restriction-modification methylase domain-containing protein, partial [Ignavibacterium album]|uniref:Eco57I restriction-modification methylase domain-containing protein n=1 Tax=Ignavibacterium album TaxID=591197 RepID=UPI0038B26A82